MIGGVKQYIVNIKKIIVQCYWLIPILCKVKGKEFENYYLI